MKKIVKICLISLILVVLFAVVFSGTFVFVNLLKFNNLPLNTESLTSPALSIAIYDDQNRPIKEENQFNGDYCKFEDLQKHTKDAFISIEDKTFYQHNGLNKKRIIKALYTNLKSGKLKEGASTISQQLIKNTHLSNEKTFERKLKEVALTKKLEKQFSKDEILESYLNIIFFGNNCYGIESASKYYFNKSAKDLNLSESCTLAGMIKSPSKYSPILHYDTCLKRRNVVLSELEKDGKISIDEKLSTQKSPISLDITPQNANKINSYSQASIDEAAKILKIPVKQMAIGGYKIHTYFNEDKQNAIKNALIQYEFDLPDKAAIIIDAETNGVTAYYGMSDFKILDSKRQPASCIKPLLVYAPALNENIISPSTQIFDEEIKIGDFKPNNVNKKFQGYVSVTDSVKNSINIPAIKVLSYIGIYTGKQYAEKLGIDFDKQDDSYALALGGMTYGVNLKDLASAYTVFPNKGNFAYSTFISYITDKNDKLVYVHKNNPQMVFREDSAYLMTNILQETAKTGTARKLSEINNTEIASKTGTVGTKGSAANTDAYNISFTPTEVIGVWFGSLNNDKLQIAGGNQPTEVVRSYVKTQSYEKTHFDVPSSVTEAEIDSLEKEENHRLVLANPFTPKRYVEKCLFSRFNMPNEISTNFSEKPKIDAKCTSTNKQIDLELNTQKCVEYQIYKDNIPYQHISDKQGKISLKIPFTEKESEIKILANYLDCDLKNQEFFKLSNDTKQSEIKKEKWYI